MKFHGTFFYQGFSSRPGVKDPSKIYNEVSLLDETEQLRCSVSTDLIKNVLPAIKRFTPCDCTFDYNTRFNSLRLIEISQAK